MTPHWLLLCALTACNWDFNRMTHQARCEPGARRPWLPDQRCDQSAPDGTIAWETPLVAAPKPPPTRELIARGRDRFTRICAPCHGALGDGNSIIARDMILRRPRSLLEPAVVDYPDQRIFDVITGGYGLMPAYAYQLSPADRWAVIYFVRVLERSQAFPLAKLPAARRQEAKQWLE